MNDVVVRGVAARFALGSSWPPYALRSSCPLYAFDAWGSDWSRFSSLSSGDAISSVRQLFKDERLNESASEVYKPLIDSHDKRQDELIKELANNQKEITSGLEDVIFYSQNPKIKYTKTNLPIDYKQSKLIGKKGEINSDIDKGFIDDVYILSKYELPLPCSVLKQSIKGDEVTSQFLKKTADTLKNLGGIIGSLSITKRQKSENSEKIDELSRELNKLREYKNRLGIIEEGKKTFGTGIKYNQPKRNAYKIGQGGSYGNLKIDLPKLMSQLRLVAHENGRKVYDKIVDFDTLDLFTKRFNSKKK